VYSQEARDAHLAEFIEKLDVGPVMLVGNSMGGLTSLGVARLRPQLVRKLVLMGSAGIKMEFSPQLLSIVHYDFTLAGMERIVDGLTGPEFVPPDGLVEYRYRLTEGDDARRAYNGIIAWQRQNGGLHTSEENIASVSVPTLVVSGKNDLVVPVSSAYRILELIPQSWGVIMPSCGHWPMIERPKEFAAIVDQFIR
jgi:2-hydroxy-6-oxo-6-(2'-aminophenyl)hexa-2,4-dienoate hydrolase